jgi:hypothetical protein
MTTITIQVPGKAKNKLSALVKELGGEIISISKDKKPKETLGFDSFSGIWSKDEANEIERIIADSCETINPDDWK